MGQEVLKRLMEIFLLPTLQLDSAIASVMAACKKMVLAPNKNSIKEELRRREKQALHLQTAPMHLDTGVNKVISYSAALLLFITLLNNIDICPTSFYSNLTSPT